jgi:MraZ protein
MSLRGSHRAKVDEKGRLKIPAEYLDGLRQYGTQFYITSVEGDTALIYPMQIWIGIEEKLAKASSQNQAKRKFLLRTSYYGQVVDMDGQGRLLLPTVLRESAKTVGEVAVFGNLDHLEVMNVTHASGQIEKDPITAEDYKALEDLGI